MGAPSTWRSTRRSALWASLPSTPRERRRWKHKHQTTSRGPRLSSPLSPPTDWNRTRSSSRLGDGQPFSPEAYTAEERRSGARIPSLSEVDLKGSAIRKVGGTPPQRRWDVTSPSPSSPLLPDTPKRIPYDAPAPRPLSRRSGAPQEHPVSAASTVSGLVVETSAIRDD